MWRETAQLFRGESALTSEILARGFESAIRAATKFAGATSPNPPVGCAIFSADGHMLSCEAHQKAGSSHAEAAAIAVCRETGQHENIDTIIVTFEPCNHFGKTKPCVDAILATPARRVWIGTSDPNPRVKGKGADTLRSAGINVGWLEELKHPQMERLALAVHRLVAPFRKWSTTGLPWVTVKQALTRSGSMFPPAGRKTFTSTDSAVLAHKLRRRADAIITGSGTVLADDPLFTVRAIADHEDKSRPLAILDRRGRTPQSYIEAARSRRLDAKVECDIEDMLRHLGKIGVLEALVEAGPTVASAILEQNIWDEWITIQQNKDEGAPDIRRLMSRQGSFTTLMNDDDVLWFH